ncbi:MAG TPA: translation elongation factor Ts [Alphaproteobacteria bacterium]|nr:translation elongation factor Ts [Alphaproteobacteria bacterium]
MAEISAALVKELREKTGAGMMDCKKALAETGGALEAAVDWLRKKGLSAAAKKAGRVASEGLIGAAVKGRTGALVEVNAETDFVARNETFQAFARNVTELAIEAAGDLEKVKASTVASGRTVADELTHLIATIGENMTLRRVGAVRVKQGIVASYIHNQTAPGLGRIGVLVGLESTGEPEKLSQLGRQIAMHIAAANPQATEVAGLDPQAVEREKAVLAEQARASGKPEEIVQKMLEGRLRKFYQEVVLLEQDFVVEPGTSVGKVLAATSKNIGAPIKVAGYLRFALGEGVEKKQADFAAEVAQLAG